MRGMPPGRGCERTAGVDKDFNGTVISVLVSQRDDNAGRRARQGVCVRPDGVRGALHSCGETEEQEEEEEEEAMIGS